MQRARGGIVTGSSPWTRSTGRAGTGRGSRASAGPRPATRDGILRRMIVADGLTRSFGGREVVDDVTFAVAPGEVVGFLGPNGAGKTTTMRLLLGLLRPTGGAAEVTRPVGYLPEPSAATTPCRVRGTCASWAAPMKLDPDVRSHRRSRRRRRGRPGPPSARRGCPRASASGSAWPRPCSVGRRAYVLDEPTQGLDPKQVVEARRWSVAAADAGRRRAAVDPPAGRGGGGVRPRRRHRRRPGGGRGGARATSDLEERFLRLPVGEAVAHPRPSFGSLS